MKTIIGEFNMKPIEKIMDKAIIDLKEIKVKSDFSFEKALSEKMTWADIIRYFEPEKTDEQIEKIYNKLYWKAYKIAVRECELSRHYMGYLTEGMIFDCIIRYYRKKQDIS